MAQLKRYNGSSWETVGGNIAPKNTHTSSTTDTYSCDYVNDAINEKQDIPEDTGWVDLSSYVNTTNFTIRDGFKPMARRIGNVVYLKGALYCTTAPNLQRANLLTNIPSQFRPPEEVAGAGMKYSLATPYRIWFEEGNILIQESANIPVSQYYQGYYLSSLGSYLVD